MPKSGSASLTGTPGSAVSNRDLSGAVEDPDPEPDQRRRGIFARIANRIFPRTALIRFLGYVRPHLWLVAGGSAMGILKFTLPLAFPLAFKYVFDVLLVPQPRIEKVDALIDRWCIALATTLHLGASSAAKLEALTALLFALFFVQAIATYFRTYWASMAGHRL